MEQFVFWLGCALFAIAVIIVVMLCLFVKKRVHAPHYRSNTEALIGKTGLVIATIQPQMPGYVKIDGEEWPARDVHNNAIAAGTLIEVTAVNGCHLVVCNKI